MNEEKLVDIKEVEKKLEQMYIKDIEVSAGRELKGLLSIAIFIIGLCVRDIFKREGKVLFQYGHYSGYKPLREWIASVSACRWSRY